MIRQQLYSSHNISSGALPLPETHVSPAASRPYHVCCRMVVRVYPIQACDGSYCARDKTMFAEDEGVVVRACSL